MYLSLVTIGGGVPNPNNVTKKPSDATTNNTNDSNSSSGIVKEQEPTEGVVETKDTLSGTTWGKKHPNGKITPLLKFDKEKNKFYILRDGAAAYMWNGAVGIKKLNGKEVELDFTAHNEFIKKYELKHYLEQTIALFNTIIKELEKKENLDDREKAQLEMLKKDLKAYSSEEEYRKLDPTLEKFNQEKEKEKKKAEMYMSINPIKGTISDDGSSITFKKFLKYANPITIEDNVVLHKM